MLLLVFLVFPKSCIDFHYINFLNLVTENTYLQLIVFCKVFRLQSDRSRWSNLIRHWDQFPVWGTFVWYGCARQRAGCSSGWCCRCAGYWGGLRLSLVSCAAVGNQFKTHQKRPRCCFYIS